MRVLVTGETGFVGRQVAAALRRRGAEPVAGLHPRPDLLDPVGRRMLVRHARAEVLVHAAWVTGTGLFWDSPRNLEWVAATLALAREFAAAGGRRVVFVGSCAEYDWEAPGRVRWREDRACWPHSLYGESKLTAWIALAAFARKAGLSAANARLFNPIGAHEAAGRLLPSLIRATLASTPIAVGPAELTRDFIDVRDAGEAIARVALSDVQGPVNIGSGKGTSLAELAQCVAGDDWNIRLGGRPARAGEPLWMVADTGRLRRATGFVPRHSLPETVGAAFAHWQAQRGPAQRGQEDRIAA